MTVTVQCVLLDAFTVYGLTFVGGLGSAIAGLTMQNNPSSAYLATCCREQLVLRLQARESPAIVSNTWPG